MTKHFSPLEFRDDDSGNQPDPVAEATRAVDEIRTASETFRTNLEQRLTDEMRAMTTRVDGIETRMQRPGATGAGSGDNLERRAFTSYLRTGREAMQADEARALRVSDNVTGGYIAPPEFVAELDRNLVLFSPVRSLARVRGTSAGSVRLPKRTVGLTAKWVGETETRPATQPSFGLTEIEVREVACYVDVSNQLLDDAAIDLEAELAFDFAEEFGRAEGAAFVAGDGVKQPLGFLNTPGIPMVKSGNANQVNNFDSLLDLFYSLPASYAANAVFGMTQTTMGALRKLKDATGRYLWADPVTQGQPATILGKPVVAMPDMPEISAGSTPIVFADFSAYRIFDRTTAILRDPYTQATNGITRFHGKKRVGAGLSKIDAFRLMVVSA